jgi:GNAT superfamily N-acetyltransferase
MVDWIQMQLLRAHVRTVIAYHRAYIEMDMRPDTSWNLSMRKGDAYLQVRRAALGDESILRDVRLQALCEAPEAFGSTYERELARSKSDWQGWLSPGVTFVLESPEGARGMIAGLADATDPAIVHLMAMWVHPAVRGCGAADELVAAVVAWAKSNDARSVRLNVMQPNHRARRFYERCGFRPTGHESIRERDGLIEVQMERPVKA